MDCKIMKKEAFTVLCRAKTFKYEAGTVKLAGVEQENIVRLARELFDDPKAYEAMAHAVNPYGDGKTSARILQAIEHYFGLRADGPEPFAP